MIIIVVDICIVNVQSSNIDVLHLLLVYMRCIYTRPVSFLIRTEQLFSTRTSRTRIRTVLYTFVKRESGSVSWRLRRYQYTNGFHYVPLQCCQYEPEAWSRINNNDNNLWTSAPWSNQRFHFIIFYIRRCGGSFCSCSYAQILCVLSGFDWRSATTSSASGGFLSFVFVSVLCFTRSSGHCMERVNERKSHAQHTHTHIDERQQKNKEHC